MLNSTGALERFCRALIQDAEVGTKSDDGADGEIPLDDLVTAKAVDQRGADRAQQADDDEKHRAEQRPLTPGRAPAQRARGSGPLSVFWRPKSLTSRAPPMLSVSFIIAFMRALASI